MSRAPDPSRRALFLGRPAAEPLPLRPPWALSESDFLSACTGCGACVDRCPEHVLARDASGRARFEPRAGECTFCGDCAAACTPGALDRRRDPPWTLSAAAGEVCLSQRGVVCRSCGDACPERAISFALGAAPAAPRVDAQRCSGCGACASVCPADAIVLRPIRQEEAA